MKDILPKAKPRISPECTLRKVRVIQHHRSSETNLATDSCLWHSKKTTQALKPELEFWAITGLAVGKGSATKQVQFFQNKPQVKSL